MISLVDIQVWWTIKQGSDIDMDLLPAVQQLYVVSPFLPLTR